MKKSVPNLWPERVAEIAEGCAYYTGDIHTAAFVPPAYVKRRLERQGELAAPEMATEPRP